jgi:hypothetical protein
MFPPLFATLKASQSVKSIVGTNPPRIYRHASAPQDTSRPYITWNVLSTLPANNLSQLPPVDRISVEIDCWHQTDSGIEALAEAVRDAVEPYAHMTATFIDTREAETKLFRIGMQFDWWLDRPDAS